jgi:hypothetical protein
VPLVRCPGCDKNLKVPDGRTGVRCPSCGEDFRLDGDRAEAPRRERVRSAADDEARRPADREADRPRRDRDDDEIDRRPRERRRRRLGPREPVVGLLPLLIAGPVGLVFVVASPIGMWAAVGALVLGIPLCVAALVVVYRLFKRAGRQDEIDSSTTGLTGGGARFLYVQIAAAFQEPRTFASWVTLEVLSFALFIEGAVLVGIHQDREKAADLAAENARRQKEHEANNPQQPRGGQPQPADDEVIDQALADLGSDKPGVAQQAANRLSTIKPNARRAEVAAKLRGLLGSREDFERLSAIKALGVWGGPDDVPALLPFLDLDKPGTLDAVCEAMGKLKDERAVAPLVRLLGNAFWGRTDGPAQKALRAMGPMAEDGLLAGLSEQDVAIRLHAAEVLKDVGTPKSRPALRKLAMSNDPAVAPTAREALKAINARAREEQPK